MPVPSVHFLMKQLDNFGVQHLSLAVSSLFGLQASVDQERWIHAHSSPKKWLTEEREHAEDLVLPQC